MDIRHKCALLAVAGYACLALLMPAPQSELELAPIGPLASLDTPAADEAMLQPLRMQASAAMRELQTAAARKAMF